jgi:hypothetical protein
MLGAKILGQFVEFLKNFIASNTCKERRYSTNLFISFFEYSINTCNKCKKRKNQASLSNFFENYPAAAIVLSNIRESTGMNHGTRPA